MMMVLKTLLTLFSGLNNMPYATVKCVKSMHLMLRTIPGGFKGFWNSVHRNSNIGGSILVDKVKLTRLKVG